MVRRTTPQVIAPSRARRARHVRAGGLAIRRDVAILSADDLAARLSPTLDLALLDSPHKVFGTRRGGGRSRLGNAPSDTRSAPAGVVGALHGHASQHLRAGGPGPHVLATGLVGFEGEAGRGRLQLGDLDGSGLRCPSVLGRDQCEWVVAGVEPEYVLAVLLGFEGVVRGP
jgi:hypothetical protein